MAIFKVGSRLYEIMQISPIDQAGHHYDCWDLQPDDGGLRGTIVVPVDDGPSEPEFHFSRGVGLAVFRHWISAVPEFAEGITPSAGLL